MRILSMTATFGKLNHEKLTLQPGLNVIQAPNEWGKSTWCAFIEAMLYGVDTRERTTQTTLAAKERFAPWSGAPMSGRMDICWRDRYITIERSTKGKVPFGEFSAYETESGLPVTELTAANCGLMLLGIERTVFTRTAFLKLRNLPMDEDEALRSRLNALVTTGDESGQADMLAGKLKTLKNRCKHNKTGLLPEAEENRAQLVSKLEQLDALSQQAAQIRHQQAEARSRRDALRNHKAHLEYAAAGKQREKLLAAKEEAEKAEAAYRALAQKCVALPDESRVVQALESIRALRAQWEAVLLDDRKLPEMPRMPEIPAPFAGMDGKTMAQAATADYEAYKNAREKTKIGIKDYMILALGLCSALLSAIPHWSGLALAAAGLLTGAVLFVNERIRRSQNREKAAAIAGKYAPYLPEDWVPMAENFAREKAQYAQDAAQVQEMRQQQEQRHRDIQTRIEQFCQGSTLSLCQEQWQNMEKQHQALNRAREDALRAKDLVGAMDTGEATIAQPAAPDELTYTREQTEQYLGEVTARLQQLQTNLDQSLGQMETFGSREELLRQMEEADKKIEELEDTYAALAIAQQTLADAANDLQRRFAPRISRQAQKIFSDLTDSRYDRLLLERDLSVSVGAQGEDTLHKSLWRSDGTVDQMYLALRLAVARELSPAAPMILDDAFVRFDDDRLASALKILQEEAETKQIILFTCQDRENKILKK